MKAVILAGGLGTRLRPFTEIIPKPLLPIGEKAVLEIQVERLRDHGFTDIILATNYKSEYIENFFGNGSKYGVSLKISKEEKALGTVGPLTLLKETLKEPFLVMNGDILTCMDFTKLYQFAQQQDSNLTVCVKEFLTPFRFGSIHFEGDRVTGMEEKPKLSTMILAGIYIMKPEIFSLIPDDTYYGMDKLILDMLAREIPISKYDLKEYWLDIGQIDTLEEAQSAYEQLVTSQEIWRS